MPEWIERILNYELLGISAQKYLLAFVVLLASLVVRKVISALIGKRLLKAAEREKARIDDLLFSAVDKPLSLAILLAGLVLAMFVLGLPGETETVILNIAKVLFAALGTWLVFRLIDVSAEYLGILAGKTESRLDDQLVPLVRKTAKIFAGVVAFVLVVQNLGYSVSGLIAGLGLGGLAFALAAKDTVSNLFGSAMIFTDRPFRIGDWVKTEGAEGTVEEVGFRSTKIRSFEKTLITIPNNLLANSVIENLSLRSGRRVKMTVGVTYETTADQIEKAIEAIKQILAGHNGVEQEGITVYFTEFAASSLDILVVYFTKTTDWHEYCTVRQEVNLSLMRALEGMGLSIAFPSQTVYLQK